MVSKSIFCRGLNAWECIATRPRVTIDIDGQDAGDAKTYTTFDSIEGNITIDVDHETPFHDIEITFEGRSRVSIERTDPVVGQRIARHTFLRLRQPIDPDVYPSCKVLKPSISYRIPFLFILPDRLLPQSCRHKVSDNHVHQTHTQLPATFGDSTACGSGLCDIAPDTCQISYAIRARVLRDPPVKDSHNKPLVDTSREVRVVPGIDQGLIRKAGENGLCHSVQGAKRVNNGLLKGNQGHLTATVCQPDPILLDYTNTSAHTIHSATIVHLRFDPENGEQPPKLSSLRSKLGVRTFYGSTPWTSHPLNVNAAELRGKNQNFILEHIPLSSYSIASMEWTKHVVSNGTTYPHPPTGPSEFAEPQLQIPGSYNGKVYYTTSITVPIYLPKSRQFVSSFYSCFISRIYTLDLCVSYHTPKTRLLKHSLNIKVPLTLKVAVPALLDSSTDVLCGKETIQPCLQQGYGDWEYDKPGYWNEGCPIYT
ncbi:hypothetical protein P170DRAFT_507982 [Aspergillus steynii IBT 23096]|uniref:Arrestin-like N-terminal domain-containing protein n=1 Tax=Aspergillus steynii IBT 23096 TaxID=1392250 RepID=A0A2I2GKA2_9EURO|nr:uncharacterized protein P170DRAFT_507982 [Aspergillus steynii IBT 23096]PLB53314.1 hypothetical protein P170DRAFT_507982 [Aspergillus steynii IBT 23096]